MSIMEKTHMQFIIYIIILFFYDKAILCDDMNTSFKYLTLDRFKSLVNDISVKQNDTFEFISKSHSKIKACTIKSSYNETYTIINVSLNNTGVFKWESGRITMSLNSSYYCIIKIKTVLLKDNGIWKCILFLKDKTHPGYIDESFNILVSTKTITPSEYTCIHIPYIDDCISNQHFVIFTFLIFILILFCSFVIHRINKIIQRQLN